MQKEGPVSLQEWYIFSQLGTMEQGGHGDGLGSWRRLGGGKMLTKSNRHLTNTQYIFVEYFWVRGWARDCFYILDAPSLPLMNEEQRVGYTLLVP